MPVAFTAVTAGDCFADIADVVDVETRALTKSSSSTKDGVPLCAGPDAIARRALPTSPCLSLLLASGLNAAGPTLREAEYVVSPPRLLRAQLSFVGDKTTDEKLEEVENARALGFISEEEAFESRKAINIEARSYSCASSYY